MSQPIRIIVAHASLIVRGGILSLLATKADLLTIEAAIDVKIIFLGNRIKERTVRFHSEGISSRLDVKNRAEAVAKAAIQGWLDVAAIDHLDLPTDGYIP